MKVLHVIPSVSPLAGGPTQALETLAPALVRAGIVVDIVTTDADGAGRLDVALGVWNPKCGVSYMFFPRTVHQFSISAGLARWLARHVREYDLVHVHGMFSFPSDLGAALARRAGVPYIIRPHGVLGKWGRTHRRPWAKRAVLGIYGKSSLSHAAAVLYTTEQERLEASEVAPGARGVVIPNAVEVPVPSASAGSVFRAPHGIGGDRPIVLFLGRLSPVKGLEVLLEAMRLVLDRLPGALLVVAGSGEHTYSSSLRQAAERLGVGSSVLWLGHIAGQEKSAVLRAADVFVAPSRSENFGIAVAEAMAARLPVVVSTGVPLHPEISECGAGLACPCKPAPLAEALIRVLAHPTLRLAMGEAGRQLVQARYSVEAVVCRMVELYDHVRAPGRARALSAEQPAGLGS